MPTKHMFLIGGGAYHNIPTLRCVADQDEFRLDPVPLSYISLAVMNLLFAGFFITALWFCHDGNNPAIIYFLVILVWLFTSSIYTIVVSHVHATSKKLGPALIYNQRSGKIELPRYNETFSKEDDVWIECITARTEDDASGDFCSELNFVSNCDGKIQRWNITRSTATINPFNGTEREIATQTGILVVRCG